MAIPAGVTITVDDDFITVKGPKGELKQFTLPDALQKLKLKARKLSITRVDDSKIAKSRHGLMRALIANMVDGVSKGFEKKLEINGGFASRAKARRKSKCRRF